MFLIIRINFNQNITVRIKMDILKSIKEIATKINPHTMFYKEGVQQIHKPFVFKNR